MENRTYIKDENSAIYELQNMLRYIARYNENILPLNPDGIFGKETEEAVKAFQEMFSLEKTGEVDFNTWNLILDTYSDLKEEIMPPLPIYAYPPEADSFKDENTYDEIILLQIILNKLAKRYDNIPLSDLTGIYDENTKNQVLILQEIFNLEKTGRVDKKTWNKIADLYSALTFND